MARQQWYKGNIHTHTTESDGDASPEKVCEWFESHGYDFLVLSDHNHLTLLDYGQSGKGNMTLIPGEEVSTFASDTNLPIHIGAIGINRLVTPLVGEDIVSTLQINIDAIRDAGGITCINHPNWKWAFDHTHMSRVVGSTMFEVYNASRGSNNLGGFGKVSTTDMWDEMLTRGNLIFGAATDDSHNYHDFHPTMENPGRGWVVVRSESGESEALVAALGKGDFYSSSGVELCDIETDGATLRVGICADTDYLYLTRFIGSGGTILEEIPGPDVSYKFRGDEGYVRAEVTDSDGAKAWVQPVLLR